MNKLLVVLLAICLVSVHAFVKRDAPATPEKSDDLQKQFNDLLAKAGDQLKEAFDPKKLEEGIDKMKKAFEDLTKPKN